MNYSKLDNKFTEEFASLVEASKNIIITAHKSPDDDAISSTLALYYLLREEHKEKNVRLIFSGDNANKYTYFKNFEKVEFVPDMSSEVSDCDLLIMLDGSQYLRFSAFPEKLGAFEGKTICIDHHSSPIDTFNLSLVDNRSSSCSELIYHCFCEDKPISKELAEIFMLGILGDTGTFSYLKPSQTETLLVAKRLIEAGKMEIQEFKSKYATVSTQVFTLLSELMKNTIYETISGWPDFQYSFLTKEYIAQNKFSDNEVSESTHIYMENYLRLITGYPWGFVITPRIDETWSVSLRSLPKSVNVRALVEKMGIGGGHDRASGGSFKSEKTVEECSEKLFDWMKEHKPTIG